MSVNILLPRVLEVGKDAVEKCASTLDILNVSRPLVITDNTMVALGLLKRVTDVLSSADIRYDIFSDTVPEPTWRSVRKGIEKIRENDYDCVIAFGGGSVIDSAKAISVIGKHGGSIRQYCHPFVAEKTGLPLIAIPTTAGTGSEVTRFTIITDETNDEKLLCAGPAFMPAAALVDYTLTFGLPSRITADTGIDAMTHAIEAYVSRKASPYSDTQALAALDLIGPNLRKVYHNGQDSRARAAMMLGSTLAGVAFSSSSVALVHGMSRPIGALFHVPHGLSNAMLLPAVTRFSVQAAPERYAQCACALGVATPEEGITTACDKLIAFLEELNRDLSVPTLQEFGADPTVFFASLENMASQALASGSPQNNPYAPDASEIIQLYKQIW